MQCLQHLVDLRVASRDLTLVVLPALPGLAQGEEVLLGPGPAQGFLHPLGLALLDLRIAQRQQTQRLALARQDGFDHCPPADAHQVADHVVELDVHPFQRLLHVLHMAGGQRQMVLPQPQVVLQPADVRRRHKAAPQQPVGMQRRTPLAILHVGLAPGQVARVLPLTMSTRRPAASKPRRAAASTRR
ncbi:MAG: hypothetical protein M5U12_35990 [Verrucomicrobia bacterium]|nr:hypothetical protein [Verrucomicrobiota bacterium]